jgi:hypothetical protein
MVGVYLFVGAAVSLFLLCFRAPGEVWLLAAIGYFGSMLYYLFWYGVLDLVADFGRDLADRAGNRGAYERFDPPAPRIEVHNDNRQVHIHQGERSLGQMIRDANGEE